jgi:putative MATE family efflux protein
VKGAAIASVTAQGLAFLIGVAVLASGRARVRLRLRAFRPDLEVVWRIVAIGVPMSAQMFLRSAMGVILMGMVAGFGTAVVAAFTVGRRLQMVAFMPAFGLAAASATLVGQNLGAQKPERAQKSALAAVSMALAVMATIGLATFVLAPQLVRVFNDEPDVLAAGTSYLKIVVLGYVFAACGIVLGRAISGAGDTVPPMIITLIGLWFLQVPLAYVLAYWTGLEERGVWWANVAASVALASMTSTYFFMGWWKKKRL